MPRGKFHKSWGQLDEENGMPLYRTLRLIWRLLGKRGNQRV